MSQTVFAVEPSEILWVPIRVTDEHIAKGVAKDCSHCPVALAIIEVLASAAPVTGIDVESYEIHIHSYKGYGSTYEHPLNGDPSYRIKQFDTTGKMESFEFMFPIPAYLLKPEAQQEAKRLEIERISALLP